MNVLREKEAGDGPLWTEEGCHHSRECRSQATHAQWAEGTRREGPFLFRLLSGIERGKQPNVSCRSLLVSLAWTPSHGQQLFKRMKQVPRDFLISYILSLHPNGKTKPSSAFGELYIDSALHHNDNLVSLLALYCLNPPPRPTPASQLPSDVSTHMHTGEDMWVLQYGNKGFPCDVNIHFVPWFLTFRKCTFPLQGRDLSCW